MIPQPRAVICDIYRTLLDVHEPPPNVAALWHGLHTEFFQNPPPCSLEELSRACSQHVERDHDAAHAAGIAHPEVDWPDVMRRALPSCSSLDASRRDDFLFRHIQLLRELELTAAAASFLRECHRAGIVLGIASNAQAYTLRELDGHLRRAGLPPDLFDRELCFWSFENGFSKPDPHVFRILASRLRRRGILPEETLVLGDRMDNDIEPSRGQGFQTWWLNESEEGNWRALFAARFPQCAASQQTP